MRAFVTISVIIHMALLAVISIPYQRQAAHGEAMSVELVPSNEAPSFNDEPASPGDQQQSQPQKPRREEAMPDFSKLQLSPPAPAEEQNKQQQAVLSQQPSSQRPAAQQQQTQSQQQAAQSQPQQQAAQPAQAQPAPAQPPPAEQAKTEQPQSEQQASELPALPPDTPADQAERLSALVHLPSNGLADAFGSAAETGAKLSGDEIAQFRAHLKSCWKAPPGVSEKQKVKVIIRVALQRNGALAAQPTLIEAAASEMGLPVYKSGVAALKACAPYTMLPSAKYKEWRVLDIDVSPDEMARG